jgi:hypothetical protein
MGSEPRTSGRFIAQIVGLKSEVKVKPDARNLYAGSFPLVLRPKYVTRVRTSISGPENGDAIIAFTAVFCCTSSGFLRRSVQDEGWKRGETAVGAKYCILKEYVVRSIE